MLSIENLFEVKPKMTKKLKELKFECVPDMEPPQPQSKEMAKDLDDVVFYHSNPCLREGFLDSSNNSVLISTLSVKYPSIEKPETKPVLT